MAAATMPFTRRGLGKGPVLVFLHGWPDTDDVFEAQYSAFKETHVMYGLLLPGYGGDRGQRPPRFTGFTLEEVCEMFIRAVQSIKKDHGGETVDLIAHDWGCVISWMALAKEPNLVRRFVALDIGAHTAPNLKEKLMIVAYQWTLVVFFFLPSALGSPLTRAVARLFKAPHPQRAHSAMNYLYVSLWAKILTGKFKNRFQPPEIPVLYLYGRDKPFFFHSQRFLDHVNAQPLGGAVGLPGGHWFFAKKSSNEANQRILRFLSQ